MASELRHILFEPLEVVEAVGDYFRRIGRAAPSGIVVRCGPSGGGDDGTPIRFEITLAQDPMERRLRLADSAVAAENHLTVDSADVTAALILHCRSQKIPLPVGATKTLQIYGDKICLTFRIERAKRLDVRRVKLKL
jgi:hypothetical protein